MPQWTCLFLTDRLPSPPIVGPAMGHPGRLDDWHGVQAVVAAISDAARAFVFPGAVEWLPRELGDQTVRARSFDAYLRLQQDRLDWRTDESRTMVVAQFTPAGQPLPEDPWSLRVRVNWPGRKDRLPDASPFSSRSLRTGRRWKSRRRRRKAETHPRGVPWERHDTLWIAEPNPRFDSGTQTLDLEVQVGLFLLQTDSVPRDGEVRDRLVEYLRRTFRWRGAEEPDADVLLVFNHLLTHKWWLDDWRGWRKLVRGCIDGVIKGQTPRATLDPDLSPDDSGRLTVDQFARVRGISRSQAYALIGAGEVPLATVAGDRRQMIAASVARQVRRAPRREDLIAVLINQGRSASAARQWIYRQEQLGRSLEDIARTVLGAPQKALCEQEDRHEAIVKFAVLPDFTTV